MYNTMYSTLSCISTCTLYFLSYTLSVHTCAMYLVLHMYSICGVYVHVLYLVNVLLYMAQTLSCKCELYTCTVTTVYIHMPVVHV